MNPNEDCDSEQESHLEIEGFSEPSASNSQISAYTNVDCKNDFSETSSNSDYECTYTPKRRCISASDSGCTTGPSSSASSYSTKVCSSSNPMSDDEYMKVIETFRKRVKKVRMNIRKKISADSDSN